MNCTGLKWNSEWKQKKADYDPPVQSWVYICSFITRKITTVLKTSKKRQIMGPRLAGVSVTLRTHLFVVLKATVFIIKTVYTKHGKTS